MTIDSDALTFHIIYTPGTVSDLLPFVDTLLAHSRQRFCLVSNGCDAGERDLLARRCEQTARLSWLSLPGRHRLSHAAALNHLFRTTADSLFCFMDSDIFATGDFMLDLQPHLANASALFSAWPITITETEQILPRDCPMIMGYHRISAEGWPLGGSYFCVYRRESVMDAMRDFPAAFERGYWDELPERVKTLIRAGGQQRLFFDTGRVLNQVIQGRVGGITSVTTSHLTHLGSYSVHTRTRQVEDKARQSRHLPLPRAIRSRLSRWRARFRSLSRKRRYRTWVDGQVAADATGKTIYERRIVVEPYFVKLLHSLATGAALPAAPSVEDAGVGRNLQALVNTLVSEPSLAMARSRSIKGTDQPIRTAQGDGLSLNDAQSPI